MPHFLPTWPHLPTAARLRGTVAWTVAAPITGAETASLASVAAIAQTPAKGAAARAAKEVAAPGDELASEAPRRYKKVEFDLAAQWFKKAHAADLCNAVKV